MDFQYAAKFICGLARDEGSPVATGRYSTVVNVHNPGAETQEFQYKLALAQPGDNGNVSDFGGTKIKSDGAMYFDCKFVRDKFSVSDLLIDGFFVIESKEFPLDVIAVYTTSSVDGRGVPAIEVERVSERRIS